MQKEREDGLSSLVFTRMLIDVFDLKVFVMTHEDGIDLIFESAGNFDGFQIFTAGKRIFADFRNGGGNGDGFQGFASPECHFADFFQAFGKGNGFQGSAERKRFLFNGNHTARNGNGFQLVLEAENTLTDTDLRYGIGYAIENVLGIKNEICGSFFLFPVEDGNADDFIAVLIFDGSDDVIVFVAVDDLGVNENDRRFFGGACRRFGIASRRLRRSGLRLGRGGIGRAVVAVVSTGSEGCGCHSDNEKERNDFFRGQISFLKYHFIQYSLS